MKEDILQTIIAHKRREIEAQEQAVPLSALEALLDTPMPGISMKQALRQSPFGIIAEFKRRSPSKDWIHRNAQTEVIAPAYQQAGASALSVLTDEPFFGGSLKDLQSCRSLVQLPLLRKDFIISPYQLFQAKLKGADAVLLIAACLTTGQCKELAHLAHELQMEVLLEIHEESELDHLNPHIDMVGVNNRHLGTFHTDVSTSFQLAKLLPEELTRVSESGLSQPETVKQLREAGFHGFLMGEAFMKSPRPGEALYNFIQALQV